MDLFLIRHAEAENSAATDLARELTARGRVQAERLAAVFERLGVRLDVVVSSPYVRARQTADILIAGLADPKPAVVICDEIGLQVRPKEVMQFVKDLKKISVALVAHQPGMCRLAAWLIGSKKAQLDLDKAGFAWITCADLEKAGGVLRWLVTPEWY